MRTKKALKNSMYSIVSFSILFILGLITRKIFLVHLNLEYLGYEGLFADIFVFLSLAEAGVGSAITYKLYNKLAEDDKSEIAKLMMIYKYMYRVIGLIVLVLGLFLALVLPYIITGNSLKWSFVVNIYFIQLISTVSTYFYAYRRTIFIADQREYVCIKIDTIVNTLSYIFRIVILIYTQNYILYLLATVLQQLISNTIIAMKSKKDYPFTKYASVTKNDFQRLNVLKDMKNYMLHKIAYSIYGGTDNIVISAVLGINSVGLFANYILIRNQVRMFIRKTLNPIQAGIGNLIYSEENNERGKNLFYALDLFSYFIAASVGICFFVLYQPFIELWLGVEYLLSLPFVALLSIVIYINWAQEFLLYFRNAFGEYEKDRKFMFLSAAINMLLSIILVWDYGLPGILIGTVIGILIIWFGRIEFIFGNYIKASYKGYIFNQCLRLLITVFLGLLIFYSTQNLPLSVSGIVLRIIISLLIPLIVNVLIFHHNKYFKLFITYLKTILGMFKKKDMSKTD